MNYFKHFQKLLSNRRIDSGRNEIFPCQSVGRFSTSNFACGSEKNKDVKADATPKKARMKTFRIYRYDPTGKKKPFMQNYSVDINE